MGAVDADVVGATRWSERGERMGKRKFEAEDRNLQESSCKGGRRWGLRVEYVAGC